MKFSACPTRVHVWKPNGRHRKTLNGVRPKRIILNGKHICDVPKRKCKEEGIHASLGRNSTNSASSPTCAFVLKIPILPFKVFCFFGISVNRLCSIESKWLALSHMLKLKVSLSSKQLLVINICCNNPFIN